MFYLPERVLFLVATDAVPEHVLPHAPMTRCRLGAKPSGAENIGAHRVRGVVFGAHQNAGSKTRFVTLTR